MAQVIADVVNVLQALCSNYSKGLAVHLQQAIGSSA
jgi:hypothetical protein